MSNMIFAARVVRFGFVVSAAIFWPCAILPTIVLEEEGTCVDFEAFSGLLKLSLVSSAPSDCKIGAAAWPCPFLAPIFAGVARDVGRGGKGGTNNAKLLPVLSGLPSILRRLDLTSAETETETSRSIAVSLLDGNILGAKGRPRRAAAAREFWPGPRYRWRGLLLTTVLDAVLGRPRLLRAGRDAELGRRPAGENRGD